MVMIVIIIIIIIIIIKNRRRKNSKNGFTGKFHNTKSHNSRKTKKFVRKAGLEDARIRG